MEEYYNLEEHQVQGNKKSITFQREIKLILTLQIVMISLTFKNR